MAMNRFALWIFACLALFVLPAAAEKKVALVIGNSEYRHAKPLPNPKRDATAMAAMLERIGFSVILGADLDRQGMADKIRQFAATAENADTVLYFYAGHGIQLNGQNYLIPVDADLNNEMDVKLSTLDIDLMLQQTPATARVKLVLLDACRDNPFKEQIARSLSPTRSVTIANGLAEMKPAFGTLIAYATGPGEVAYDGNTPNSPFTTALLNYLPARGLEIGQAMTRVRASVYEATAKRQLPWENKNLTRDYYLVPAVTISDPDATATLAPAPAIPAETDKPPQSWTEDNAEIVLWQAVKESSDPAELQAYLDKYGDRGIFAAAAKKRIAALDAKMDVEPEAKSEPPEAPAAATKKQAAKPAVKQTVKKPEAKAQTRRIAPKAEAKTAAKKSAKKKPAAKLAEKPAKKRKAKKAIAYGGSYDEPPPRKRRPPVGIGIGIGHRSGFGLSFGL
jgi:uncharacterized caspase-like protein